MIGTSRRHSRGRKKTSGSAALHVLGDGWTTIRGPRVTLGPFDTDPAAWDVLGPAQIERLAARSVELVQRRTR